MKWVVDAQLPRRLSRWVMQQGHDAVHTLDLPRGNHTTDEDIVELSLRQGRIVVTKDVDFVDSFLLKHRPEKLLVISTGNITNTALETLFHRHFQAIAEAFEKHEYLELTQTSWIVHE
jgi:predicted nuclease of predicted toxin-antitoxin system